MQARSRVVPLSYAIVLGLFLVAFVAPGHASAHERRDVAGG